MAPELRNLTFRPIVALATKLSQQLHLAGKTRSRMGSFFCFHLGAHKRWCDNRTAMPHANDLSAKAISGRACFEAEMQMAVPLLKPGYHLPHGYRGCANLAQVSDLVLSAAIGHRYRVPFLGYI
jgi:hypothetical protein